MDFESAMWRGYTTVFPDVTVRGCTFHWRQAVWRKVQELGLRTAYTSECSVQSYIRKLMALPMLPVDTIRPQFQILKTEATTEGLKALCSYMEETWMGDGLWAPQAWCVFKRIIRTNNDVEGWHRELGQMVGIKPPFYSLVEALFAGASFVPTQVLLVSEGKLRRLQKKAYRTIQSRLQQYWEEFENGGRSVNRLLRASSRLFGNMDH